MPAAEQQVRSFFAGWAGEDPRQAFADHLAEDCIWLNTGLPVMEGKAACIGLLDPFIARFPKIVVEIAQIGSNDEVVFVQRTDRLLDSTGTEALAIEVTGVLRLREGRIVHWYDYFDPSPFAALMSG
jgi:limonene-1,2-epoxide hydrolase